MEEMKTLPGEVMPVFDDDFCIRIRFETPESSSISSNLHAYFVLDRSGSMAGRPIRDAKGALGSFITKVEKLNLPITVIAFNDRFEKQTSKDKGYVGLKTWVEGITGQGGTLFKNVFKDMEKDFVEKHLDNTYIMILSDGQDNEGLDRLTPYMESFKNTITKNNFTCTIHTIGFSGDHDAKLLSSVTTYGTKVGTFQYVAYDGRIPVAVNNASEFLYQSSIWGQYLGVSKEPVKLEITDDAADEKIHYGLVYLKKKDMEKPKVELYYQGKKSEHNLELKEPDVLDLDETVQLFTTYASNVILKLIAERQEVRITKEEVPKILDKIQRMDKHLDELMATIRKKRSLQRKQIMPFCLQTKDLFNEFLAMIKEDVTKELSNLRLAQLNKLAYQDVLQRSLQKKINKRVGANAGMLDKIDEDINKVVKTMDFTKIAEEYKDETEKYGHCLISYKDWLDALQDGDSFCLTFDAHRPKSGIMDPSMVTITTINTTQLTAESFLDSALFVTKAGQLIKGEGQHGASATTLVKGLPDEVITGVMPLFINPEHWKVARLRMPPLLAWTVAQDVLAFEPKQLTIIPFLLLAKAALDQTTEHKKLQFKLIFDTCMAIYKEHTKMILPDLKVKLEKYLTNPEVRTVDSISNNRVFLIHLYVASQAGDIDAKTIPTIFPHLMEEELRRGSPSMDAEAHEFNKKMLGVDESKYISPYILAFQEKLAANDKKGVSEAERFKQMLKEKNPAFNFEGEEIKEVKGEEKKDEGKKLGEELKIELNYASLPEKARTTLEAFNKLLVSSAAAQTAKLLPLFGAAVYANVSEIGIDTPIKQLMFVIQTVTQKVNADRREAIQKGLYVSPFDQAAAEAYLTKLYTDTVVLERENRKSKILAEREKNSGSANAQKFAITKDVYEAAGIFYGIFRGSNIFHEFHKSLRIPNCPLVLEKVKMMTSGQYLGVKLLMDDMKKPNSDIVNGYVLWKPTKQHAYKIWHPNRSQGTLEQWKEAFPYLTEYLDHQDKRLQGIFVPYTKPRSNVNDPRHHGGAEGKAGAKPSGKKHKKKHHKKH